ncbi:MAG: hypothetical protein GY835_09960 [bacterium]|nr:hypothetical protein [bacterium]
MLQQLVQPTRWTDGPLVPHIRPDEFGVRQARIRFRDQAKVQNIKLFMEREEERQKHAKPLMAVMDQLTGTIAGPQPQNVAAVQQVTPPPNADLATIVDMDMQQAVTETEKVTGDDSMGDGDGAQGQADKEDMEIEEA